MAAYGLYLIDNGENQFLWLGRDAVPALIQDVFGTTDKNLVKQGKTTLPVLDGVAFNEQVRAIVEEYRDFKAKGAGSITVPEFYVVREDGEPALRSWAEGMTFVEDKADQGQSLQQFLGVMREKVSVQ